METNLPQESLQSVENQNQYFEKLYFKLRMTSVFLLVVFVLELYPLMGLLSAMSSSNREARGWGVWLTAPIIILSLPVILVVLIFQTRYFLKTRKSPEPKNITFPRIMMFLGYVLALIIVGLWVFLKFFFRV